MSTHQAAVGLLDGAGFGVTPTAVGHYVDVAQVQDAGQDTVEVPLEELDSILRQINGQGFRSVSQYPITLYQDIVGRLGRVGSRWLRYLGLGYPSKE